MKHLFLAFSALVFIAACTKKTADKSSQTPTTVPAPVPVATSPEAPVPTYSSTTYGKGVPDDVNPNLVASLQRSPCFGYCPTFKMEVFADGTARYQGSAHVARLGNYTAKVDAAFIKRIEDKALSIKYLSLLDHYPTGDMAVSDVPTVTSYVRIGKDGKRITNNYDPPKALTEFEQWLEAQFEGLNWQIAKE
jgi:hypothetical protein